MKKSMAIDTKTERKKYSKDLVVCSVCGKTAKHYANGMCSTCYKVTLHREQHGTLVRYCDTCGRRIYGKDLAKTKCSACQILSATVTKNRDKEKVLRKYRKLYAEYGFIITLPATRTIFEMYLEGIAQSDIAHQLETTRQRISGSIKKTQERLNLARESSQPKRKQTTEIFTEELVLNTLCNNIEQNTKEKVC